MSCAGVRRSGKRDDLLRRAQLFRAAECLWCLVAASLTGPVVARVAIALAT
jgi:hypothetical protein